MKQITNLIDTMDPLEKLKSNYTYNGVVVPRTTEIISKCIHADSFMYWANSLGFKHKSYKKTLDGYADIGTQCHETIDKFINNGCDEKDFDIITRKESMCAYESFLKWWSIINTNNKVEVIYNEKRLVCKYFGGTLDGLYKINGQIYLIDYKTSNHVSFRYCLQLAAYRYMLREEYGINIDKCIILQLSKYDISFNEFVLDLDNINHLNYLNSCEQAFLAMVYSYYNICNVEKNYKILEWGD